MKNILFFNTVQNKAWRNRALFLMLALVMSIGNAWGADSYYTGFKTATSGTGIGYVYGSTTNTSPTNEEKYHKTKTIEQQSSDLGATNATKKYYAWAKANRGSEFKNWTITSSNNNTGINPTTSSNTDITITVTSNVEDGTNTAIATAEFNTLTSSNVTCHASEYGSYSISYSYEIATGDDTNGYTFKTEEQSQLIESGNSSYGPIELYPTDVVTLKVTTNTEGFEGWYKEENFNAESKLELLYDEGTKTYTYPVTEGATEAIYAKFAPSKTFYGKLTTQIASSSIGSGGKIYTSTIETANPAYTDQPSTIDATPKTSIMEATSVTQTYHLYAQPTDGRYMFLGWFNNEECTGEPLSNDLHYTYSMEVTSEDEENPTIQTLYACFDLIIPYYLQVNALAADPLTGMVLVSKENRTNPDYKLFEPYSSATIVASATNVPPTATAYVYAEPSYGYSFEGWYADAACKTQRLSTANPYDYSTTAESTNAADPTRKNLYAKFTEATTVDITYNFPTNGQYAASVPTIIESNGEYVWKMTEVYNSTKETTNKTVSLYPTNHLILSATPKEGYGVQSWTDGSKTITTVLNTYQTTITSAKTLGVTFVESTPYLLKGTNQYFSNLQIALNTARDGSNKVVVVVKDACVPAGEYTIPSGVTLLVPYDKTDYKTVKDNNNKVKRVYEANVVPDCVITLTMAEGANIIVEGQLEVGGEQNNGGQTNSTIGSPRSHGKIKMHTNSTITLENESHLYCWGYIVGTKNTQGKVCGQGTILAKGGAAVHECLQIRDWKGGTASLPMEDNKERVFPVNQYYIQNIEVPITFNGGAKNLVSTGMLVSKGDISLEGNSDDVPFVDQNSGLFQLSSDAQLKRDYIEDEDRIEYRLNGNAEFKELNFSLKVDMLIFSSGVDIKSANYLLPVTNNMTLHIESGEIKVSSNILVSPGAEIFIHNNATVTTTGEMYVFDKEDWLGYEEIKIYPLLYANETVYAATASGTKKQYIRKWDNVQDAKICVDGKLKILGPFYTTGGGGADICSTDKGEVIFNTAASTAPSSVYQVINQTLTYVSKTANPAWLHNDEIKNPDPNNKYTLTAGAIKDDVFVYSKEQGRWLKNPKTITWNSTGGTCAQTETVLPSGVPLGVLPVATKEGYTFKGWFTAESSGEQITTETIVDNNVTYYAQWKLNIEGTPLDIVDADGTNLTINANGWASSGWPYKIKDNYRFKGVRAEDRTLTIPYSGELNADMPIVLKDKEGTVVSSHIYKVPFVYNTSNATLSGTDASSIVFVKSGTLTIEDNISISAKEIYVAPGAELKVTGTLTVGKLVLRTTPWQAAVLTIGTGGSIELAEGGQVYYSRIAPNKSTIKDLQNTEIEYNSARYYQFGLPLSCDIEDVTMSNTGKFGASNTPYGNTWLLKSYSESKRAENGISSSGDNWEALESTGTITAGVGYEMFSNSNYYREFYFPVDLTTATTQVSVQYTGGTIGAEHNGWNIITSPLTSRANVPIIDPATAFKVCWLQADGSYEQKLPTVIPPAIPFSCQVSAEGELNFAIPTIAAAPRKQSAAEALTETEWVHLDIFDAYGEGDETSLFVHPTRFEQTYKTGIDVAKQSLTAARPTIYSTHAYGDMAFAGVADSLLENGIDIAVYSPAAQELTFSLRENKFLHRLEYLWLADNETGTRTDLLMDDYTCRANAGTTKGRFVLNGRFKAPQISTGITNTQTDYNIYAIGNNIAISGVEQGTPIYVFDAVGHMIYTTSATSDEVIVPAPCAGVYMLTIGGQTAKLVINK